MKLSHHPLQQCEIFAARFCHLAVDSVYREAVARPVRSEGVAANYDGAVRCMVGADTKRDALLSNAAARAAVVDFVVSVVDDEFDEAVFCRGEPCILCLTPRLIGRFVLMAEPIID